MFQSYDSTSSPEQGPARLAALRDAMSDAGLTGFIVPLADAHQGEYVAPCDARLAWLTGFTGSAGFAIVLPDIAGVFIDGRYKVQVRQQVDTDHFTPVDWPATKPADWLKQHVQNGKIGFDPWVHTVHGINTLRDGLDGSGVEMVESANLVDAIWDDRPPRPDQPIRVQPIEFAGKSHNDKRTELAAQLRDRGAVAAVLTLTDSLCWLLNIRGSDIPRNPIVQGFAVLHKDASVDLFTGAPVSDAVRDHLGDAVRLHPRDGLLDHLNTLTGPVLIDADSAPLIVNSTLATPMHGMDPCALPKARKNATEINGTREAHLRDGAAVVQFLAWLDQAMPNGLTEIDAAQKLESFRHQTGQLLDISFDTISSTGPNGAINHYRVTHDTNRTLQNGDLFLVDSGGQYMDGTTDITRTVPVGNPTDLHRTCYTRVLQGVIAISRARFPRGIAGAHLDALARYPLWVAGLDFDHGVGHGVGSYLCVHEGPQRLSGVSHVPFEPGMILSNEPGYYREGEFGIRLENLIVVRNAAPVDGQDARDWLDFENLTWVPFDRRLIVTSLLTPVELDWLNTYHADTLRLIGPRLDDATRGWLERACAPL